MKPRICICCGEPMAQGGHALSRNANLCASCSSMADGMLEDTLPEPVLPAKTEVEISDHVVSPEHLVRRDEPTSDDEVVVEWKAGRLRKRE